MRQVNIILLFLYSTGQISCSGQPQTNTFQVRQDINSLVDSIAKDNILKSSSVGYAGVRTAQWARFEKLREDATDQELIALIDHQNAVVRCYSFQALATRNKIDIFPVLLKHINDTTEVETFQGCIISSRTAGDYYLDVVTPQYIDLDAYKLTSSQKATIDSILLFDKRILVTAKYNLLSDIKPQSKYYERIREIAITEKSPVSILALARFQNKKDIEIIKTLFDNEETEYYGAYSSREFPDNTFYPYLVKIFEKEWNEKLYDYPKWRILYQALAKYPSEKTYKLFERTTQTKDDFRYQTLGKYLLIAIKKYPNSHFDPLISRIKLEEYYLNDVDSEMNIED